MQPKDHNIVPKLRIGSRSSRLALVQVEEVRTLLQAKGQAVSFETVMFSTAGDKDKTISLTANTRDDFFTDTLDQALLDGTVDAAVHSAKDLPQRMREGLEIFALTEGLDPADAFVGRAPLRELPAGARVGTSSLVRQEGIRAINPGVLAVDIRGTVDERLKQLDEGKYDGVIVAVCALKRLGLAHRITEVLPWEATPLQGQLAVVGHRGNEKVRSLFRPLDVRSRYGKVYLVGAGPGDPDLITMRGVKVLGAADCVFYDYLAHPDLLKYAPRAEIIYVGKRKGSHSIAQVELSRRLRDKALQGKTVVRLKGGDPLIFARGGEEVAFLRSYLIDVEPVPGVSSATGIPSGLGIPLTARGVSSSVTFLSGHTEDDKGVSDELLEIPRADTIIFLMALTKLSVIVRSLKQQGWAEATPFMIISRGTRPDEKVITGTVGTIEALCREQLPQPPALMIIGNVVHFWDPARRPRQNILYVGTNPDKFQVLGQLVHLPMIRISEASIPGPTAEKVLSALPSYDILLLTSRFAVRYFLAWLKKNGREAGVLQNKLIAVIGQETADALQGQGLVPHLVAQPETSEGMLAALQGRCDLKGKRVLFPRSALPNPFLKEHLTRLGAEVAELAVYDNTKPSKRPLPEGPIHKVLFTSPSTVRNFLEDYGSIPGEWKILAKGPHTQACLREAGYESETLVFD